MKKSLLLGFLVVGFAILYSLVTTDWRDIYFISGTTGLLAILGSGATNGAFVTGDRYRANYGSEEKAERMARTTLAMKMFVFALPNLAAAILYLMIA